MAKAKQLKSRRMIGPNMLPPKSMVRREREIPPFVKWMETVPYRQIQMWLQDALWKGQIQDTEMYRAFVLEHYKKVRFEY